MKRVPFLLATVLIVVTSVVQGGSIDLDLNSADNTTFNPPEILATSIAFFLVEDTAISTDDFNDPDVTIDEVRAFYDIQDVGQGLSELRLNRAGAVADGRIPAGVNVGTSSSTNGMIAQLVITGVDSSEELRRSLLSLEYDNGIAPDVGFVRTFGIVVDYTINGTMESTEQVNITMTYVGANDDGPVVTADENEFSYVEDETSNVSFAINVTDPDHPSFPMMSATVEVMGGDATDRLSVNANNLPSGISVNASEPHKLQFYGAATTQDYASALSIVFYYSTAPDVGVLASRTIKYTVWDGMNEGMATITLNFVNVNDPPALAFAGGVISANVELNEDVFQARLRDAVAIIMITDSDNMNMTNATVIIDTTNVPSGALQFSADPADPIQAMTTIVSANETKLTFSGSASIQHYQNVLLDNAVVSILAQDLLQNFTFLLKIIVNDGLDTSNYIMIYFTFVTANDAPLLYLRNESLPGYAPAPAPLRQHNVTFVEDSNPIGLLPNSQDLLLEDIDSHYVASATIALTGILDSGYEVLSLDEGVATSAGIAVSNSGDFVTLTGMASLMAMRQVLLTVQYQNRKDELPSDDGVREVNFVVVDAEGAASAPFTVFVRVEQRNDAPSLNINDGNVTFTEGSPFGIHIVPHPHRVRVTDGDTVNNVTFNYIARLRVVLTVTLCGQLDYNATTCTGDFLYWVKQITDPRIQVSKVGHTDSGDFEIVADTQGIVADHLDAAALDDAYEKFIGNIRYVTNVDEPTLFCDNTRFNRLIHVMVTDSGTPPETAVITTQVNIQTINDHPPTFQFSPSQVDCIDEREREGSRRRRSPMEQTKISSLIRTEKETPVLSDLTALGFSDSEMEAGSSLRVTFFNDTDMPRVLERESLSQIVKIEPFALANQPHLAFWESPRHLLIIYPFVQDDAKISASEIALKFNSGSCTINSCAGRSDPLPNEEKEDEPQKADDIEPTQLHDWALFGVVFTGMSAVVALVVYLGCKRSRK